MLYKTLSAAVYGIDANLIEVEVDVAPVKSDKDYFTTVGLPDTTVRESRERIRAALKNSGYDIPSTNITINLAPGRYSQGRLRLRPADGARGFSALTAD